MFHIRLKIYTSLTFYYTNNILYACMCNLGLYCLLWHYTSSTSVMYVTLVGLQVVDSGWILTGTVLVYTKFSNCNMISQQTKCNHLKYRVCMQYIRLPWVPGFSCWPYGSLQRLDAMLWHTLHVNIAISPIWSAYSISSTTEACIFATNLTMVAELQKSWW